MGATTITTDRVRVPGASIPADAVAVSYRRTADNVWLYRFHKTTRGAKIAFGKYGRAYDACNYQEYGWKIISDTDRTAGVWLW